MKRILPFLSVPCCLLFFAVSLLACANNSKKPAQKEAFVINFPDAASASAAGSRGAKQRRTGSGTIPANPADYENLWDRLIDQYNLPEIEHREIDKEVSWFVNHPTYIDRVQKRAEPFLYSIVRQIEKYDVPGEIALLPVIESAFQPHVVSPASAAGIWQFIPATGKNFGLKRSRSYDGRRDVYASTRAAIKYLKKLQNDFHGDWLLAVAAYNCGEGTVGKAVQRNESRGLSTDFWSLDLPQETRSYVPRLLAVSRIFADPVRYGVDVKSIPNKAMYKTVRVTSPLDLALAAQAADLSLEKMLELNPGFKHPTADVDGTYRLFVPAHKYQSFKEQLPQLVDAKAGFFAKKDYEQLLSDGGVQLNEDLPREDAGAELSSGPDAKGSEPHAASNSSAVHETIRGNAANEERQSLYVTHRGDTLATIAKRHGVSEAQIKIWNHLSGKSNLKPGTKLVMLDHHQREKKSGSNTDDYPNKEVKTAQATHRDKREKSAGKHTASTQATHEKPQSAASGSGKSKKPIEGHAVAAVTDTKKTSHSTSTAPSTNKKGATSKTDKRSKS